MPKRQRKKQRQSDVCRQKGLDGKVAGEEDLEAVGQAQQDQDHHGQVARIRLPGTFERD